MRGKKAAELKGVRIEKSQQKFCFTEPLAIDIFFKDFHPIIIDILSQVSNNGEKPEEVIAVDDIFQNLKRIALVHILGCKINIIFDNSCKMCLTIKDTTFAFYSFGSYRKYTFETAEDVQLEIKKDNANAKITFVKNNDIGLRICFCEGFADSDIFGLENLKNPILQYSFLKKNDSKEGLSDIEVQKKSCSQYMELIGSRLNIETDKLEELGSIYKFFATCFSIPAKEKQEKQEIKKENQEKKLSIIKFDEFNLICSGRNEAKSRKILLFYNVEDLFFFSDSMSWRCEEILMIEKCDIITIKNYYTRYDQLMAFFSKLKIEFEESEISLKTVGLNVNLETWNHVLGYFFEKSDKKEKERYNIDLDDLTFVFYSMERANIIFFVVNSICFRSGKEESKLEFRGINIWLRNKDEMESDTDIWIHLGMLMRYETKCMKKLFKLNNLNFKFYEKSILYDTGVDAVQFFLQSELIEKIQNISQEIIEYISSHFISSIPPPMQNKEGKKEEKIKKPKKEKKKKTS